MKNNKKLANLMFYSNLNKKLKVYHYVFKINLINKKYYKKKINFLTT